MISLDLTPKQQKIVNILFLLQILIIGILSSLIIFFYEDDVISHRELKIYKQIFLEEKQQELHDVHHTDIEEDKIEEYSYHWYEGVDRDTLITHVKDCCYHKNFKKHVDTICHENIISHVKICCKHDRIR